MSCCKDTNEESSCKGDCGCQEKEYEMKPVEWLDHSIPCPVHRVEATSITPNGELGLTFVYPCDCTFNYNVAMPEA